MDHPRLDHLYITDALDLRPARAADYRREMLAIQELTKSMAKDPDGVLPKLVDLAMSVTDAVSAGISLFEAAPPPGPGVFRWHHLRGTLEAFTGATTPRDFSPCGVTLDSNTPVLISHPEHGYTWLDSDADLPEVLLVPLYVGDTEPLGTLWVVAGAEGHFTRDDARALTELATFAGVALSMQSGQRRLKEALARQENLTSEMSHRVNNVFAITNGMIRMTAKSAMDKEDLAQALLGRVQALSSAHSLIRQRVEAPDADSAQDLQTVLRAILAPHDHGAERRFRLEGPLVICGDQTITGMALIFHELATNSAKYGALKNQGGHVDIHWSEDGDDILIAWTETGGPNVLPPSRTGFGSTLIKDTVRRQFNGELSQDWRLEGLRLTLRLPKARLIA